jgi:hypothetical protein
MYKRASANTQRALARASNRYSHPKRMSGVVRPIKTKEKHQFTTDRDIKARERAAKKSAPMVSKLQAKMMGRRK